MKTKRTKSKRPTEWGFPPVNWQCDFEGRIDAAFGLAGVPRAAQYLSSPESLADWLGHLGQPDWADTDGLLWWANVPNPGTKAGASAPLVGVLACGFAPDPIESLEPWTVVCVVPAWARPWFAAYVPARLAS